MAHYDPYSNNNYYNANNYADSSESGASVATGVKQFVTHAVGFLAFQGMAKGALKLAGRGVAGGVAKWAAKAKPNSFFDQAKLNRLSRAKTFTQTVRASSNRVRSLHDNLRRGARQQREILSARDSYLAKVRAKTPVAAIGERFKSAFRDRQTLGAVAGRVITRDVMAGSLLGYVWDAATGQLANFGVRDDISAWNVPGHAINYGKYMVKNAGTFAIFGNLPKLAGGAAGAVGLGAKKAFANNTGFRDTVMDFASKVAPSRFTGALRGAAKENMNDATRAFEDRVNNMIVRKRTGQLTDAIGATVSTLDTNLRKAFNSAFDSRPTPNGGIGGASARASEFQNSVVKLTNEIKHNFKQRQQARTAQKSANTQGLDALNALEEMASRKVGGAYPATLNAEQQKATLGSVMEMISSTNDQMKPSKLGEILGARATRVGDIVNADYIQSLSTDVARRFALKDSAINPIAGAIKNLQVGNHHYKVGKFNADLSFFSPMHVAKRALAGISKVNLNMAVPMPLVNKNMSLGAITGLDTVLSDEVGARMFTKDTTGLGSIIKTKGGNRTLAELLGDTQNIKSINNDVSIGFFGRNLYSIDGYKISKMDANGILKSTSPSITGMSEIQKSQYNKWLWEGRNSSDPYRQNLFRQMQSEMDVFNKPCQGFFGKLAAKFDWQHTAAQQKMREIQNVMASSIDSNGKIVTGHQKMYRAMGEVFEGKNVNFERLHEYVPYLKNLMDATEQEVSTLIRKPGFMEELAKESRKNFRNNPNILYDSQTFAELLNNDLRRGVGDPKSLFHRLTSDKETKSLYDLTINNTTKADTHVLRERFGRFSDMKAIDSMRVKYLEASAGMGDNMLHPFVTSAKIMAEKGILTRSEATSMKIYGMAKTMFRSIEPSTAFKNGGTGREEFKAIREIFKRHQIKKQIELTEFNKFIQDTDLRPPTFFNPRNAIAKQLGHDPNKILDKYVGHQDFSNTVFVGYKPGGSAFMGGLGLLGDAATNRLTNLIGETTGFKRDPFKYGNGMLGAAKFIGTRSAQISAAMMAYKVADAGIAMAPIFDQTALDDGITGAIADGVAKTHLMSSRFLNATGIAGAGRYLSGLMPGFTSTALGTVAGAAMSFSSGPSGIVAGMFRGAIGSRMLSAYMPDFTKTYEQLQAEYSGESEVPIIKGRGWLLGSTPWQGNKVVGYKPSWYVEAKSRWKASESLYGSEFRKLLHEPIPILGVSIGDFVDPYYMERKHYFTRPYHATAGWQENLPFGLGPLVSNTIGQVIKPKKIMHEEFLKGTNDGEQTPVSAAPIPTMKEQQGIFMRTGINNPRLATRRTSSFMGSYVYPSQHKMYAQNVADDMLRDMENAMGLVGFASNTARTALVDKSRVYPTLETAGRMASTRRSYDDMNIGGLGVFSEVMRRFISKPNYKKSGVNETPNMLPNWLPERFLKGDPYVKILKGELRLPGKAFEMTHDINFTLPGRASMFGADEQEIVKYFTGFKTPLLEEEWDILETGTQFHENIQQWLKAENILISAEDFVYDAKNNITGHIDGVIQDGFGGRGRRALEIKSISDAGLEKLSGPKNQHVGQLNFYLHEMGMKKGTILYVSRDNPANYKVFEIDYNPSRYTRDVEKINKARGIASQMIAKGKQGMAKGFSYSWVDRMKILADVAPASKEWKEAKWVVNQQMKNGMLTERDINKYRMALKQREATLRQFEAYPMRFKGKIMSPDAEYNRQNINENIKAAAEYSLPERVIGAAWETFTNTNTFLTNKFFSFKDPLEHYKQYQVYGKEFTPWTDPYGSFIQPRINNILGAEDPLQGAISAGVDLGFTFGGLGMGTVGTLLGAAYGGINGLVRGQGSAYIPGQAQQQREVNDYFDTLKYYRNQRMAQLSEGFEADRFRNNANQTLHSMMGSEAIRYTNVFKAAYDTEKPYIHAWLNERDPDRQVEILSVVPERLANVLQTHWKNQGSSIRTREFIDNTSMDMATGKKIRQYDMRLMDPGVLTEDIKLKTINNEGLNAHDFGLGWSKQMLRIQDSYDALPTADLDSVTRSPAENVSPGTIRAAIQAVLSQNNVNGRVKVFVNNHAPSGDNQVTINVQHDRTQDIRDAVDFRERYR